MNPPFRRRGAQLPILSPDEGKRQGHAVRAAQAALGSVDQVRAFLNSRHEGLNGRPIDVAIASEAGLIAVEAAIAAAQRRQAAKGDAPGRKGIGGTQFSTKGPRT
jgi:uncharacterized protein (DUF2384 family)